jgi:hypothetical protein
MSDDLQDLVTKEDMPMMTKQEMRKTHENQHKQVGVLFKKGKKVKKTKK